MAKVEALIKTFRKEYGESSAGYGTGLSGLSVLPTGIFPLDLAIGGGLPRSRITGIFGPEGSGKTTLALKAIAAEQALNPKNTCAYVDVEGCLDMAWAARIGVDPSRLVVVRPQYGEQVVDVMEGLAAAEDAGVVVLDSIATIISKGELDKSAEDGSFPRTPILMSLMFRKLLPVLIRQEQVGGTKPVIICVNQIRTKIGVMYGNPESQPGGHAKDFAYALNLRVAAKNIFTHKNDPAPTRKETTVLLKKWKFPIFATAASFNLMLRNEGPLKMGDIDDWSVFLSYAKAANLLVKHSAGGWVFQGKHYPTQDALKTKYQAEPLFALNARALVAETVAKAPGAALAPADEPEGD